MNWLENIRSKPKEEKIKLIWKITVVATVILIILWILLGRFTQGEKKDLGITKTIEQGISDFKKNK